MKDTDYNRLMEFQHGGGFLRAMNDSAQEYVELLAEGEMVMMKDVTARDLKYHNSYHLLLAFIWDLMPNHFRKACPKNKFYKFIKKVLGQYDSFFVGKTEIIEFHSLSFGRMSQKSFEKYVKNTLPQIYELIILPLVKDEERYNQIIEWIEQEFERNKIMW